MSTTNDGGPAFPYFSPECGRSHGMTLRDYFAAQAIVGMIGVDDLKPHHLPIVAGYAYTLADAMLAERAKAKP